MMGWYGDGSKIGIYLSSFFIGKQTFYIDFSWMNNPTVFILVVAMVNVELDYMSNSNLDVIKWH